MVVVELKKTYCIRIMQINCVLSRSVEHLRKTNWLKETYKESVQFVHVVLSWLSKVEFDLGLFALVENKIDTRCCLICSMLVRRCVPIFLFLQAGAKRVRFPDDIVPFDGSSFFLVLSLFRIEGRWLCFAVDFDVR